MLANATKRNTLLGGGPPLSSGGMPDETLVGCLQVVAWARKCASFSEYSLRYTFLHPLTPLVAFSFVFSALISAYFVAGYTPTDRIQVLGAIIWALLLAWWIVADARRREGIPCFDFGFFCYLFLPVAVPWYCLWSRGWRGVFVLFLLATLWLAPYFIATIVWQLMYGR
jgi:hypothetical protein